MTKREMSHKLVGEMLAQSPSQEFSLVIEAYWSVWKSIETQIRKIEQNLKEKAKTDPYASRLYSLLVGLTLYE